MKDGLIVRRGTEFLARKSPKARQDETGRYWSEDIQKARVYQDFDHACRAAYMAGGVVVMMKDLKAEA